MSDPKPCTRCHGSGTEPDPVQTALLDLAAAIETLASGAESDRELRQQADQARVALAAFRSAAGRAADGQAARIASVETALRDILGHFDGPALLGEVTMWRADNKDVEAWRRILDGGESR